MPRRTKKPPRPVYHDGLIPATHDTYQSYPEIVPDDHDQIKHEKSYPELAPPQPDPESQQQQQTQQQQQSPEQRQHHHHHPSISTTTGIIPPPTAHSTHHHHHPLSGFPAGINPSPLSAPPIIHPLSRTSGVHSLRQAWSEVDDDEPRDGEGGRRHEFLDEQRPVLWKRPIFWVVVVAGAVIVALAGVLGGVASGGIKTAWDSSSRTSGGSTTTTSTPSVTDPTCPGSANLNYTSSATTSPKTFRIQCAANYPDGDGDLGLVEDAVDSIAGCLDACAQEASCVGAVFKQGDAAKCWLKQFIGVVQTGGAAGGMVSGVLWQ
ncbi:hypothetical protein C8A01DRAFT_46962 [Parachaetomium inaequale]|uniref:Apple domain-containing protein n=1 Tax=Parachaetomium inaequale TaxID=2588326 RepID=A0AAN6PF92_9PEZI|nr:hypothetical protein C8A01DRAFT_46962 [Parachaetomium inaequale]